MKYDFTKEDFDAIINLWCGDKEEFVDWVTNHGIEHINRWFDDNEDGTVFSEKFAYFIVDKYIEWKNGRV